VDPFLIIADQQTRARAASAARHAESGGMPSELDSYLDVEERIIYPMLDRCGEEGADAMAEGQARHVTLIELAEGTEPLDRLLGALDAHIDITRARDWPLLRRSLRRPDLEDLGDALVEALASREVADVDLDAPFRKPPIDC
jgi:hypothetical protein